ncbi:MAG TPA: hypothetical protein VFK10_11400 [Burkholderiaceae bacterium]|nr:hypothetical protein [Burkholderiaceae bacterium]
MNAEAGGRITVVLDDVVAAAAPLAWSSALARALQRELQVVYVERTAVLAAAALPITQALAHAAAVWMPYGPADIERGFRLQVARLRELMRQVGQQHALSPSLQIVRGALHHAAMDVDGQSDLVLMGAAALLSPSAAPLQRCRSVLVWSDDSEQGAQLVEFAMRCAQSLGATPHVVRAKGQLDVGEVQTAQADLLVLPRAAVSARVLAGARRPLLLVGRKG